MALFALAHSTLHSLAAMAAASLPHHVRAGSGVDPLVQGAERAVQAYSRASDAYAADLVSVALWALVIAAGIVLLEWVAWRYRRRR